MNAPVKTSEAAPLGDLDDFRECCAQQRWFYDLGILPLATAVDNLQWLAERWDLIALHGQGAIQDAMALAFAVDVSPASALPALPDPAPPQRRKGPAQSTVDAFKYVLRCGNPDALKAWLRDHVDDAPALLEHLEAA